MFSGPRYRITSTGIVNCLGLTREDVFGRVQAGRSGLASSTLFEQFAKAPYQGVVGAVDLDSEPNAAFSRRPRQELVARSAVVHVQTDTLAACHRWGGERVGLILGTSTGGIAASERAYAAYRQDQAIPEDYSFEKQHAFDGIAHLIASELSILGPTYVVSTACSSSAKALAAGGRLIGSGLCDAVLVGGVDSLCLTTLLGFQSLGVVDPNGCRPFAIDRAGISIGEGAAFLLLEREANAGAFLVSVGESSDAHHMAHPHPDGVGAEQAMRQAVRCGGIDPDDVDYINAHGTGTTLNDAIEAAAIARVFGNGQWVTSTKRLTGHLLGAAGATEAVLAAAAIEQASVPGNGDYPLLPDAQIVVPRSATPRAMHYVLSNSLAFGGSNASVLLASATELARRPDEMGRQAARSTLVEAELVQATSWVDPKSAQGGAGQLATQLLAPRTRGRASQLTCMFADLLGQLADGGFDAASSPVVFGSAYGEMATTMELLELQASSGQSSPLRFQLSVHNTAAGLLSIALGNRGFSTSIAAGTNTFAMAMLEGIVYLNHAGANEVAVLVADEASVSPLSSQRHGPVAAGFHLRRVERTRPEPCWLVRAPCRGRVSGDELARVRADRDNENPVSDALDLVAAFRGQEPRKLLLGKRRQNHEPASHPSGWVLELVRHPGA